ncbi:MAG: TusE/DsrC/DsvC family sulfur relay protein [Gemmatimonadetes bacterium]|nr:TusE/DsrC/DsvC family sulfur relay protein [Gemmatimonadota bacterium]NNM06960.1 TusE/DsrC/DsvC family sulfur relay protein [Gemmatimonadota bacterium]
MTTATIAGITVDLDSEGFMTDAGQWTRELAEEIARANGIDPLTPRHWEVIEFCRQDNEDRGTPPTVRRITKGTGISTKEVYQLFPKGPGILASKISGLSKPKGCI